MKKIKSVSRMLLLVLALPIALVVVFFMYIQGCKRERICDPVHRPETAPSTRPGPGTRAAKTVPQTKPTQPPPIICDPVHMPPPRPPQNK